MAQPRKIVVEAIIPAAVELVWERTQDPGPHVAWDIRFTDIRYLDDVDGHGFHLMDYQTRIGFGITVRGIGRYLHSVPLKHSTFEFESSDWKAIITKGRGIWLYEPCEEGTYFKTVYDYAVRWGMVGRLIDRVLFRRLMQPATEWGFETLRLWCGGDEIAATRRTRRSTFIPFLVSRLLGRRPAPGSARSWLGSGQESELSSEAAVTRAPRRSECTQAAGAVSTADTQ